jgi:uncharacterized membrane protein YoaK (UPF0700 family)
MRGFRDDAAELSGLEARLPPLLSVIAGMVDFTGFCTLALAAVWLIAQAFGRHGSSLAPL